VREAIGEALQIRERRRNSWRRLEEIAQALEFAAVRARSGVRPVVEEQGQNAIVIHSRRIYGVYG
jgi:hypothetical protein